MKVRRLWREMGPAGYGIYVAILEVLCDENEHKLSVDDIDLLASGISWDETQVRNVVFDFNLFEIKGGKFWSPELTVRSTKKTSAGLVHIKKDSKINTAIEHYKQEYNKAKETHENTKLLTGYSNLIKFIFGKNETQNPLDKVLTSFEQQLTFEQYARLTVEADKRKKSIADTLLAMENWGNPKKRKSVFLTALQFIRPKD